MKRNYLEHPLMKYNARTSCASHCNISYVKYIVKVNHAPAGKTGIVAAHTCIEIFKNISKINKRITRSFLTRSKVLRKCLND